MASYAMRRPESETGDRASKSVGAGQEIPVGPRCKSGCNTPTKPVDAASAGWTSSPTTTSSADSNGRPGRSATVSGTYARVEVMQHVRFGARDPPSPVGRHSHQIVTHRWAPELLHAPAGHEVAEVDRGEARGVEELRDRGLRGVVVDLGDVEVVEGPPEGVSLASAPI
jgi:hypothetical protein